MKLLKVKDVWFTDTVRQLGHTTYLGSKDNRSSAFEVNYSPDVNLLFVKAPSNEDIYVFSMSMVTAFVLTDQSILAPSPAVPTGIEAKTTKR
jgi:hypothetical protein